MTKIKSGSKRVFAVVLALTMLLCTLFTGGMTTVYADSPNLTQGLTYVANVSSQSPGYELNNAGIGTATNITGGGVKLDYLWISAYKAFAPNVNLGDFRSMTGFTAQFANFTIASTTPTNAAGYGKISLVLSSTNATGTMLQQPRMNVPFLELDTNTGKLNLMVGTHTGAASCDFVETIVENTNLIYQKITGKPFSITVANEDADYYRVSVTVGTGAEAKSYTGRMTKSKIFAIANAPKGATYTSICASADNRQGEPKNAWSVEFYGFKVLESGYELLPITPPQLSNGLQYKATSTTGTQSATGGAAIFTDLADGGVRYSVASVGGAYKPYVHNVNLGNFPGAGIRMQFDNYVNNAPASSASTRGYGQFMIEIATALSDSNYKLKTNAVAILFDTVNGKIELIKGLNASMSAHEVVQTIATGDALKYENFTGRSFTVDFDSVGEDIKVTLTVAPALGSDAEPAVISGNITAANIAALSLFPKKRDSYLGFSSVDCNNGNESRAMQLDYYGLTNGYALPAEAENLTAYATANNTYAPSSSAWVADNDMALPNGKGVKYGMFQQAGFAPFAYNQNLGGYFGNFKLVFSNYKDPSDSNTPGRGNFLLMFSNSNANGNYVSPRANVMGINVNTATGAVTLVKSTGRNDNPGDANVVAGTLMYTTVQTLFTNDAFKYANFTGKVFTYTFMQSATEGMIDFKMTVGSNEFETTIPVTNLTGGMVATASTGYISFGAATSYAGSGNKTSQCYVNFYGYEKLGGTPCKAGLTQGLTDVATIEKDIETRTDIVTRSNLFGGGVRLEWANYSGYAPYRYNANLGQFPKDGIRFQFGGYKIASSTPTTSLGYGQIVICVSNTTNNDGTKVKRGDLLVIDTVTGDLTLQHSTSPGNFGPYSVDETIIDNSDLLKYNNLKGKDFNVIIQRHENGTDYVVTVDVDKDENTDATKVSGTMSYSNFALAANAPITGLNSYMSVGGFDNATTGNAFSIEFYGYEAMKIEAPVIDTSALTEVADKTKDIYNPTNGIKEVTDLENGGVKVNYPNSSAGHAPFVYATNIGALDTEDGVKLQLSNYINNSTNTDKFGHGQLVFVITNANSGDDYYKIKKETPFLQIDTVNGDLLLRHCKNISFGIPKPEDGDNWTDIADGFVTDQVIIDNNDLLKANKFSRKAVSITFKKSATEEGNVDITIEVGGDGNLNRGQTITGILDMEILGAFARAPKNGKTYVSIGGLANTGDTIPFSFEFYGYQNYAVLRQDTIVKTDDAAAVSAAITALGNTASDANAEAILKAKAQYDSLSADKKAQVANASALESLVTDLNALRNGTKFKPESTFLAEDMDASLDYPQFQHNDARTLFSKATDNGFSIEWRGSTASVGGNYQVLRTQGIYGNYPLDGMRVHIDNYTFNNASSDFHINFTNGGYEDSWGVTNKEGSWNRLISIRLGLANGALEIYGTGRKNTWIAGQSDLLKRDNLKDKDFIIEWRKQSNGDYICYITVDTEVVAFTIEKAKLDAMQGFNDNAVRAVIGTVSDKNVMSMEVTGIYGKITSDAQAVIDKLNALSATVTSDADVANFEQAEAAYNALSTVEKQQIRNVTILTKVRGLVRDYKGYNEYGRDVDNYYVPVDPKSDLYGEYKNVPTNETPIGYAYSWNELGEYGGIKWLWNNAVFGIKNCFDQSYVMDGLSVRLDNFKYASAGGFIVGFENSSNRCKVFATSSDTRNGIYLYFGKNNTVYSSKGNKGRDDLLALWTDEKLSATNLVNKEFFIHWDVVEKEGVTTPLLKLVVEIDGTKFEHLYDEVYMASCDLFNIEDVELILHTFDNTDPENPVENVFVANQSIDVTGVNFPKYSGAQQDKLNEVIEAIDTLPDKASADIKEKLEDIWSQYMALSSKYMREGVTNFSKLLKLYNELFDMLLADGTLYGEIEAEDEVVEEDFEGEFDVTDDEDYASDEDEDITDIDTNDEIDDTDEQDDANDKKKPVKVPTNKKGDSSLADWIWIVVAAGAIVLLGAAAIIIVLVRRKANKEGK